MGKSMEHEAVITRASIQDAEAILDLQRLAYVSEARLYNDWSIPPLTQTIDGIRKEFENHCFLKTTIGDSIVGSVRAVCDGNVCRIGRLIVHPDFQRQSIGTHLTHAIEAAFSQAEVFALFTGEKSVGNIRLYSHLGYAVVRSEQVSPLETLVHMEKRRKSGESLNF